MPALTPAMKAYFLIVTAALGLVMGSFTACMAWRIARGEDFVRGRSHCDSCGHVLGGRDLIPVLSWIVLRGRCRYCGAKISAACPLTELLTAAAFVAVVLCRGFTLAAAELLVLTVLLLAIALVDLDTGLIPDRLLLAVFLNFVVFAGLNGGAYWSVIGQGLLSGLTVAGPLLVLVLIMDRVLKKESMGGGDLKLFYVIGLYFDWKCNLFNVMLACVLGIVFTLVFSKVRTGDGENPRAFPFGPSIAAASYVTALVGERVVDWYLRLFL